MRMFFFCGSKRRTFTKRTICLDRKWESVSRAHRSTLKRSAHRLCAGCILSAFWKVKVDIPRQGLFPTALLFVAFAVGGVVHGQNQSSHPAPSSPAADYPAHRVGVLIQRSSWIDVANAVPTRTRAAHGIAASLSYGAVRAKIVAEYEGDHASTQVDARQLTICICHMIFLPGEPVIVRLHPKKGARELDGGRMIVYPLVGGSKTADANKSDLIPVDVAHPDPQVWLVHSQSPLSPGEYALMLGTQNLSIFPFTVMPASAAATATK